MKDFNVLQLKLHWSKTHETKSKYKFFTFKIVNTSPSKLLILIIDHAESCFFLPLLNPLFHHSNLPKIFNWPCTSQKTVCSCQNLFFLQNKGSNNPIRVGSHTKINSRLFKLDSKTLLQCHSAIMSPK